MISTMPPPITGESGVLIDGASVPLTAPMAYVPCAGEVGVVLNGAFTPLEYITPKADDVALPQAWKAIDREAPWIDQSGMTVATPCVSPYDWEATAKTIILDTIPDVDATDEEKALPGYVANPGLTLSSRSTALASEAISISDIVAGRSYQIAAVGTSDFTLVGAGTNGVGVAFVATTPDFLATALVATKVYKIKSVGTTDFTAIGAASNTVGLSFIASGAGTGDGVATVAGTGTALDCIGFLWTYGATPADPHPTLRTGQTRYTVLAVASVGTLYEGKPFIPGTAGAFVTGTLKVIAFTRGLFLSSIPSYTITVKIGRATATWDKSAGTLALACDTSGATIKYSVDGSAPTLTYSTPIAIAATTTVRWYATKTGMEDSTEWQTAIAFAGDPAEGPADFETVYFSTLPTFSNSPVRTALKFQRRPNWYVAPGATGDGLTPSTPGSMDTIVGLSTTTGSAKGTRTITVTKSGTADVALARSGENPTSSLMKYSTDNGANWTTYSTAFALTTPGRFQTKLIRADATDFTRIFQQPWFIGTGMSVRAVWDDVAMTLTLSPTPAPAEEEDYEILYSLDGSTPSLLYSGPITIAAATTPKYILRHVAREPHDFPSISAAVTGTAIDPTIPTASFTEDKAVTLAAVGTIPSLVHTQEADIVWASEGFYNTTSAGEYFYSASAIVLRGGYNYDFTERDVKNRKTTINAATYNAGVSIPTYNIHLPYGIIDGFWGETELTNTNKASIVLAAAIIYNCHFVFSETLTAGTGGVGLVSNLYPEFSPAEPPTTGDLPVDYSCAVNFFYTPLCYFCTADVTVTAPAGNDGQTQDDYTAVQEEWWYAAYSIGGAGAHSSAGVTCGATALEGCVITIDVTTGAGGAGGDGGGLYGGGYGPYSKGGAGGYSYAVADCAGTASRSTVNLTAVAANGGLGGSGGTCGMTGTNWFSAIGGAGGASGALARAGKTIAGSATTSATSADGAAGGYSGDMTDCYADGSYATPVTRGGAGGSSYASASASPEDCEVTVSAESGDGGNGGDWSTAFGRYNVGIPPAAILGGGAPGSSSAFCEVSLHYRGHATATATAGDGGSIARLVADPWYASLVDPYYPAADTNHPGGASTARIYSGSAEGYLIEMTAATTCGEAGDGSTWFEDWDTYPLWGGINVATTGAEISDWDYPPVPCQFFDGDLTWTSTGTRTKVNPLAVNAVSPLTAGWYSGTVNSDGAPIDDYGTAQGTGVVLGDYWD